MLKSLFIQNFVLIDSLDIQFDNGFFSGQNHTPCRKDQNKNGEGHYLWCSVSVRMERV
jgi:hypothetical protein